MKKKKTVVDDGGVAGKQSIQRQNSTTEAAAGHELEALYFVRTTGETLWVPRPRLCTVPKYPTIEASKSQSIVWIHQDASWSLVEADTVTRQRRQWCKQPFYIIIVRQETPQIHHNASFPTSFLVRAPHVRKLGWVGARDTRAKASATSNHQQHTASGGR